MLFLVNTDGASRGNPGLSAISFIIRSEDGVILHQEGRVIGESTNNIAEYTAVKEALGYILNQLSRKLPASIELQTDSQLVASQLSGSFKVKHPGVKALFDKIKDLEPSLGRVSYKHIPRRMNFIADRLCNIALDNFSSAK